MRRSAKAMGDAPVVNLPDIELLAIDRHQDIAGVKQGVQLLDQLLVVVRVTIPQVLVERLAIVQPHAAVADDARVLQHMLQRQGLVIHPECHAQHRARLDVQHQNLRPVLHDAGPEVFGHGKLPSFGECASCVLNGLHCLCPRGTGR